MKEERKAILRQAEDARPSEGGLVAARIEACDVVLAVTGDGPRRGGEGAAALCDAARPAAFIGAGIAGALTPGLAVGDVVVGRRIFDARGEVPAPDARLLERAIAAGGAAVTLQSVDRPAVSRGERAVLAEALGAERLGAADMESAAWARAAAARGVPYLVVRAISDALEDELPAYLPRCVGADGRIRRVAVVAHALRQPATIPTLLRMRRRVARCGEKLALFLRALLAEGC